MRAPQKPISVITDYTAADAAGRTPLYRAAEALNFYEVYDLLETGGYRGFDTISKIPYSRTLVPGVFCNAIGAALNSKQLLLGRWEDVRKAKDITELLLGTYGKSAEEKQHRTNVIIAKNLEDVLLLEEKIKEQAATPDKYYLKIHEERLKDLPDEAKQEAYYDARIGMIE